MKSLESQGLQLSRGNDGTCLRLGFDYWAAQCLARVDVRLMSSLPPSLILPPIPPPRLPAQYLPQETLSHTKPPTSLNCTHATQTGAQVTGSGPGIPQQQPPALPHQPLLTAKPLLPFSSPTCLPHSSAGVWRSIRVSDTEWVPTL